jgi:phosphohistidine phosphatase
MRLYLVQHGDALPKDLDPERPLSAKGRQDAAHLGGALARSRLAPARIYHSGKLRAKETAELISSALSGRRPLEHLDGLAPNDPVRAFMDKVEVWWEDVIVVGHLPFMSKLVAALVAGNEEAPIAAFEPGSMVCVERDNKGHWRVVWMIRPDTFE